MFGSRGVPAIKWFACKTPGGATFTYCKYVSSHLLSYCFMQSSFSVSLFPHVSGCLRSFFVVLAFRFP